MHSDAVVVVLGAELQFPLIHVLAFSPYHYDGISSYQGRSSPAYIYQEISGEHVSILFGPSIVGFFAIPAGYLESFGTTNRNSPGPQSNLLPLPE